VDIDYSLPRDQDCHELWSKRRKRTIYENDSRAAAAVAAAARAGQLRQPQQSTARPRTPPLSPPVQDHCLLPTTVEESGVNGDGPASPDAVNNRSSGGNSDPCSSLYTSQSFGPHDSGYSTSLSNDPRDSGYTSVGNDASLRIDSNRFIQQRDDSRRSRDDEPPAGVYFDRASNVGGKFISCIC